MVIPGVRAVYGHTEVFSTPHFRVQGFPKQIFPTKTRTKVLLRSLNFLYNIIVNFIK